MIQIKMQTAYINQHKTACFFNWWLADLWWHLLCNNRIHI